MKGVLPIPKIGLIIGGILGIQTANCLLTREFGKKDGIIFKMLGIGIVIGCDDQ